MLKLTATYSERQYKYRFSRLKNFTADEYAYIDHESRRRAALGKQTQVYLHNRPVPLERISRGIGRFRSRGFIPGAGNPASNCKLWSQDASLRFPSSSSALADKPGVERQNRSGKITFRTPSPVPLGSAVSAPVDADDRREHRGEPSPALDASTPGGALANVHADLVPGFEDGFSLELLMDHEFSFEWPASLGEEPNHRLLELGHANTDIGPESIIGNGMCENKDAATAQLTAAARSYGSLGIRSPRREPVPLPVQFGQGSVAV